jgi:hypothetical protein
VCNRVEVFSTLGQIVKTIVVCEEDPSYAAVLAHLLYVGVTTLAITHKQFKDVVVKVVGKTDGWSPFCMKFFGECSYYDEFRPVDKKSDVLYVLSYSLCQQAKLISAGLQKFTTSILSLPLLESVASTNNYDFAKIDSSKIANALVPANDVDKYRGDFRSMEEEQVYLADCVYCVLEVLQKVVVAV